MTTSANDRGVTLRLLWPQWQGAGRDNVAELAPDLPLEQARRGYAVGTQILQAVLPEHDGPTARPAVEMDTDNAEVRDGIESKTVIVTQLDEALAAIREHDPARIVTLGGECAVSIAPFSTLAQTYGDDLAVVWIDAHPDLGTPESGYAGHHAMALSLLVGHGDAEILDRLPARVDPARASIVGLHEWTPDDIPHAQEWGITTFAPDDVRTSSEALLTWLAGTGCSRVAIHLDVDVVDSEEVVFGLGAVAGGLRIDDVRRLVADIASQYDVVGLTVAEFIPRQVMHLQRLLRGFPLLG